MELCISDYAVGIKLESEDILLGNCQSGHVAGKLLEAILNEIINEDRHEVIAKRLNDLHFFLEDSANFCRDCASCYDYFFFSRTFDDFASGRDKDKEKLRISLHEWKKTQLRDEALTWLSHPRSAIDFNYEVFSTDDHLVYLDQNLVSDYSNDGNFHKVIEEIKAARGITFLYSPSHLEEVNKVKNEEDVDRLLNAITALTGNVVVLPGQDKYFIAKENPSFSLARVRSYQGSSEALEDIRLISADDRSLFLKKYEDDTHKKRIGQSADIFNSLTDTEFSELMHHARCSMCDKDSFKGLEIDKEFLHAVYSLYNALDLLSFKIDSSRRTIKSSTHDIEHLIYGGMANTFVTKDKNLYMRAKEIYGFMGIKVEVLLPQEFLENFSVLGIPPTTETLDPP